MGLEGGFTGEGPLVQEGCVGWQISGVEEQKAPRGKQEDAPSTLWAAHPEAPNTPRAPQTFPSAVLGAAGWAEGKVKENTATLHPRASPSPSSPPSFIHIALASISTAEAAPSCAGLKIPPCPTQLIQTQDPISFLMQQRRGRFFVVFFFFVLFFFQAAVSCLSAVPSWGRTETPCPPKPLCPMTQQGCEGGHDPGSSHPTGSPRCQNLVASAGWALSTGLAIAVITLGLRGE